MLRCRVGVRTRVHEQGHTVAGVHESASRLPSTQFTAVVNCGDILSSDWVYLVTPVTKRKGKAASGENAPVRATISFPSDLYKALEELAREKKVSIAWVVRDAAEQYVKGKCPLSKERP